MSDSVTINLLPKSPNNAQPQKAKKKIIPDFKMHLPEDVVLIDDNQEINDSQKNN